MTVPGTAPRVHKPFVPANVQMKEFTLRAVLLGLVMCVVLGAANAYLGLRAGQTIAATYPAAVIGMAVLRVFKGSILEENIARTAGSIGESVAAGAIFTIPAFVISRSWLDFSPGTAYWKSTSLMLVGSVLGVLFVSLVRRALVEDPELPFPESVAASQIHKAGQVGAQAAKFLFYNMAFGSAVFLAGAFSFFATDKDWLFPVGQLKRTSLRLGAPGSTNTVATGGLTMFSGPTVSPAYIGVGYVIGPTLASLNFSGSIIAWGLLIPLLIYFLGPQLATFLPANAPDASWFDLANGVWRFIVRPIAVGGMLFGAAYTLFRMRKALGVGLARAFAELKTGAAPPETTARTERYMSSRVVLLGIFAVFAVMIVLYRYLSGGMVAALVAAIVMLIVGFCFATVSGYLVGVIGSSNNPISGLTLSTVIIAAWDDWGGWYDHVPPPIRNSGPIQNSYEYGFRVPIMVISPYAKPAYASHQFNDFGSILKFIEEVFSLPAVGKSVGAEYADSYALGDLSDFFNFNQTPLTFTPIQAPKGAEYFIHNKAKPSPPDND